MRGLLTKDLCLIKGRGRTISFLLVIFIFFSVFAENTLFYMIFLLNLTVSMACSTISYDEFDNGYAFLFTLPVTRRKYVQEKYIFSMALTAAAGVVGLIFGTAARFWSQKGAVFAEQLPMESLIILMTGCVLVAVSLPVYLKYGAEKGNIVIAVVYLALAAIIVAPFLLVKELGSEMPVWMLKLKGFLDDSFVPEKGALILLTMAVLLFLAALLYASLHVSYRVMERREF